MNPSDFLSKERGEGRAAMEGVGCIPLSHGGPFPNWVPQHPRKAKAWSSRHLQGWMLLRHQASPCLHQEAKRGSRAKVIPVEQL